MTPQEEQRWEVYLKEMEENLKERQAQNPFDKTVANAMANENVEMTIKKNTQ